MKTLLTAMLVCGLVSCVSTQTKILREFPDLATNDGTSPFQWEHHLGPDFDVWHGIAESGGVGVYSGNHPSWDEEENWPTTDGHLGVFMIKWHVQPDQTNGVYHTALIPYRKIILKKPDGEETAIEYLHVWAYGPDGSSVSRLENALSGIRLFQSEPAPNVIDVRDAFQKEEAEPPARGDVQ